MDDIVRISKDIRRANGLREMAKERFNSIGELKQPYRIVEEYYEIIKELLTAVSYSMGFKILSHKTLIEFISKETKILDSTEISLIDELRITRNNIVYYGEKSSKEFIESRKEKIHSIINKLLREKVE